MEERIIRVETTLDKHSTQINKLFSRIEDTNNAIQKINNSICISMSPFGGSVFGHITATALWVSTLHGCGNMWNIIGVSSKGGTNSELCKRGLSYKRGVS